MLNKILEKSDRQIVVELVKLQSKSVENYKIIQAFFLFFTKL